MNYLLLVNLKESPHSEAVRISFMSIPNRSEKYVLMFALYDAAGQKKLKLFLNGLMRFRVNE